MFPFLRLAFVIIHLFLVLRSFGLLKVSISRRFFFFWKYRFSDLIKLKVAVPKKIGEGMCGFYLWFLVQDCSCKIIISLIISTRDRSKFFYHAIQTHQLLRYLGRQDCTTLLCCQAAGMK